MCENTEVWTVRADSVGSTSNTSFVSYFNIPLRNVIKAELLAASFHANANSPVSTSAYYVHVEELKTKFLDRAELKYTLSVSGTQSNVGSTPTITVSNASQLATSLVCVPVSDGVADHRTVFTIGNYFPVEVSFIEPIRQITKLTVNIYSSVGAQPTITGGPTFLTFRFTCAKPNTCLYPN